MRTTYNKFPEVYVQGYDDEAWQGWASVHSVLRSRVSESPKTVLVIDCYPGVRLDELEQHLLAALNATVVINVESARRDEQALHELLARNLTDDRVFGVLSCHH
ncbi:MAG: mannose-6-phosphate isomerase, partial [Citrobacter sp.]